MGFTQCATQTFLHANQIDAIYTVYSSTQIKTLFDSQTTGIINYLNNTLLDELDEAESDNVKMSTNQTITGTKTFSASPNVPTPTANNHPTTKGYVDGVIGSAISAAESANEAAQSANSSATSATSAAEAATAAAENAQEVADTYASQLAAKAKQVDLDTTNAVVAEKADKSAVTNVMTPKGNIAYASLPTTGNTIGWYYYCSDGDGTHGAGNYAWNGASWYFSGTGDEGYSKLKSDLSNGLDVYSSPSNVLYGITQNLIFSNLRLENGYYDYNGTINESSIHKHFLLNAKGIKKIEITPTSTQPTSLPYVLMKKGGVISAVFAGNITQKTSYVFSEPTECELLINAFSGDYALSVTVEYWESYKALSVVSNNTHEIDLIMNTKADSVYIDFSKLDPYVYGYMHDAGVITQDYGLHILCRLKYTDINKILLDTGNTVSIPIVFVMNGNTVVKTGYNSATNKVAIDLNGVAYTDIYINWFNGMLSDGHTYPNGMTVYRKNISYNHSVKKKLSFNAKVAEFTGDSITHGFVNTTTVTENGYPKLFSNAVGMSYTNRGVGGASISRISGYPCIQDQVTAASTSADYIFIAGGVNDWQLGVSLSDFKNAIQTIMTYLNNSYNGNVIWITPINEAGWSPVTTPVATLQTYRNIITRTVMEYNTKKNMSIVQGDKFNFPDQSDDVTYIAAMFGDKLHPTELGYSTLYLNGLLTALC